MPTDQRDSCKGLAAAAGLSFVEFEVGGVATIADWMLCCAAWNYYRRPSGPSLLLQ